MKQLLLSVAIALTGVAASAGEFSTTIGERTGRHYITFDGPVEQGDVIKLQETAMANPDATWISLRSPGGLAEEGYALSSMISDLGLNTYVGYGSACVSACYTAFLGGAEYDIDGVLAAHNSWISDTGDVTVNDAINFGQQAGSRDSWFHAANGFNLTLSNIITHFTDKDTFLTFTNEADLLKFFARNEEDKIGSYLQGIEVSEDWISNHVVEGEDLAGLALINLNNDYPDRLDPRKDG